MDPSIFIWFTLVAFFICVAMFIVKKNIDEY